MARGGRLPVDSRIVRAISRSPGMTAEQGPSFMGDWGGPTRYTELTRYPVEARVIWFAIEDGTTDPDQLEIVTGLSKKEVSSGLAYLSRKGDIVVEKT